jgi:signal transduction histidine kinase
VIAKLPGDSDLRADVQEISRAADRAADVTRGLLAFSRRKTGDSMTLDLNEIVSDLEKLLKQLLTEDIESVSVLMPGLAPVEGDRSQIEQVIVNMAVNARDAMPEGGKLVIETANLDLVEPLIASRGSIEVGRYVTLAVSDTGFGMDDETRARVFEPFFTTKGPDRGTGLGLSSAFGIVEAAGGRILVDSEPGKGTTFTVYLPRSADSPAEDAYCSD